MSVSEAEFLAIRDRMAANRHMSLQESGVVVGDFRVPFTVTPAKRAKFGNVKKEVDGHVFDSSAEARRYIELKAMQAAGQIVNLELQPRYVLLEKFTDSTGKKHREMAYVGDFRYLRIQPDHMRDALVCEDTKGMQTPVFRLKWKMAIQKYPNVRFELSR